MANKKNTEKYNTLHWWLRRSYGSAGKCENSNCDKKSKRYEWALLKGKEHAKDIKNYWQLCRKCHFKYDLRPNQVLKFNEGRKLAQNKRIGLKHSEDSKRKMSQALMGREAWNKGRKWSDEVKKKMSISHLGKIPWNKGLILC